jgi:hypothetical protein
LNTPQGFRGGASRCIRRRVKSDESVVPRAEEILEEFIRRIHLIELDTTPDVATHRANIARLDGDVETDLTFHTEADLVNIRLLHRRIDTEDATGDVDRKLVSEIARNLEGRRRNQGYTS